MKLSEMTICEFDDLLASDAPAPGGGSVAALSGSVGVALASMVASLTLGKEQYAAHQEVMEDVLERANDLRARLVDMIDRDTESFNAVSAVFAMPKGSDEEKAARKAAMQQALIGCVYAPCETMELALAGLETAHRMLGISNSSAASDLGVAALTLRSAVLGAWLNVLINIDSIEDEAFASEYRAKGGAIVAKALPLADEIYETIVGSLTGTQEAEGAAVA